MSQRNLSKIARTEAVDQLSSTEQLDQRLVVVNSSSWIILVIASVLLVVCVAWGIFGRLPTLIEGEGVIAPAGTQPIQIASPSAVGGVIDLMVPEYSPVKQGDPLVRLHNEELQIATRNAESRVSLLQEQDARLAKAEEAILSRQKASLDAQLAAAKQTTDQTRKLSKLYEKELSDIGSLVDAQLVPRSQLVQTQQEYFSILQQLTQQETIVAQANEQYFSLVNTTEQARLQRAAQLAQAQDQLATARANLEMSTVIHAPISGTVLEHAVDLGSTVGVGTNVTSIQPHGDGADGLVATVFVPYGTGRRIEKGMDVRLSLPFVQPSRYGYIRGTVKSVSTFVAGSAASVHLGSRDLAEQLSNQMGTTLEIMVDVELDEQTPTGFRWTSGRGYDRPITLPALCGVQVVVSEDRPIDLVLPWIKDVLGLDPQVSYVSGSPG